MNQNNNKNLTTPHRHVKHPNELLQEAKEANHWIIQWNDKIATWITDHILASLILFDLALIVPLLLWNANDSIKLALALISGSWVQLWALPALQRSQNKTQAQNDAKATVDHKTLTYLAHLQDEQMTELKLQTKILEELKELRKNLD